MLDRDELAARATAARAALLSLCEALSALVPVAPASGATATEPRRTVGAVVRDVFNEEWVVVDRDRIRKLPRDTTGAVLGLCDTDTFSRWANREECERHGLTWVDRGQS